MGIYAFSPVQLSKLSTQEIQQMKDGIEKTKLGYQNKINNPNEKNEQTKARFNAEIENLTAIEAQLQEAITGKTTQAQAQTKPAQNSAHQSNPYGGQGQGLNLMA